jgi:outer membrane lipoprotein-sorting protein
MSAAALPAAAQAPKVSRASLANAAAFTVTSTVAPRGGPKASQAMRVEVKGNRARVDFNSPQLGPVRYLANDKGVFLYIPANKVAQKMPIEGGVNGALQLVYRQINDQLASAKKVGTATVDGQATDVYKDPRTGATLYVGRNPGFRLPVKTVLANEGGTRTVAVTNIKLNPALPDARFAVPAGTQVMEATGAPGGLAAPGIGR